MVADLPQDLRGQVAAGFAVLGFIGHVAVLRATWLVSPAVGRLIALIAGKLLVLQPAISQLVADAQTAGLTVDGPDGPGHADRRAVLDLPAATPGPEGRSWQVLNKQIKDIIQKFSHSSLQAHRPERSAMPGTQCWRCARGHSQGNCWESLRERQYRAEPWTCMRLMQSG